MKDILKEAYQARKDQDFLKASGLYHEVYLKDTSIFNEWDAWSYAFSLSKLYKHLECLELCRIFYKRFPGSEMIRDLYAKSIYYTQFKAEKLPPISVLSKATQAIFDLSPYPNPYSYTVRAVFAYLKILMSQQQINWTEIEHWLNKIDPDLLDAQSYKFSDDKGKTIEMASPKEEWYSLMIRTQGGLNQPEKLLVYLERARKQKLKWHYNNDIWFKRKEAFAYMSLGQKDRAEKIMKDVLLLKKDWFLLYDLAQILDDVTEKRKYLCRAALAPGKYEHKIRLYEELFFQFKDDFPDDARNHLKWIAKIRLDNDWSISDFLKSKMIANGIVLENAKQYNTVIKPLQDFWKSHAKMDLQRKEGFVSGILPNGKSGFIKAGSSSFFFNLGKLANKIKIGDSVSFELIDGFDKKKNIATKNAVNIQILKS